jgi:hypothetical protein
MHGLKQHIRLIRSFCGWSQITPSGNNISNPHEAPLWHALQRPMGLEDQETLEGEHAIMYNISVEHSLRTRVGGIYHCETIFANIAVSESYDICHTMLGKFFPGEGIGL